MTGERQSYDVVVVGAGVAGCSIARALSADHEVLVLEKDNVATGATGRSSGHVAAVNAFHHLPDLAHHCVSFFREFDGTGQFAYNDPLRVTLVQESMEEDARELARDSSENGFSTTYLTAEAIDEKYAGVFDLSEFAGGIEYQDMGWVDPYTYTVALKEDAERLGCEVRTGVTVDEVSVEEGHVTGVETDAGTFDASTVVCAAGWQTRGLLRDLTEVPVYPLHWQIVDLDPGRELDEDYPMGMDVATGLYWRLENNGNLHVGGGEFKAESPGTKRNSVTEEFREKVAREVPATLRGLDGARIVGENTCEMGDSATPDTLPILDAPPEAPDGLIVATGFHGVGVTLSPVTATAVRSLVTGEECPFSLETFAIDRFDSRSADFEFVELMKQGNRLL